MSPFLDPTDFPANIIKGHGRKYAAYLFFRWKKKNEATQSAVVNWLSAIQPQVTSASAQKTMTEHWRKKGVEEPVVTFSLSYEGFEFLGVEKFYEDFFEKNGAPILTYNINAYSHLADSNISRASGVIMVAHNTKRSINDKMDYLKSLMQQEKENVYWYEQWAERRDAIFDQENVVIGPLGYADGLSNPVNLEKDCKVFATQDPLIKHGKLPAYGSMMSFVKFGIDRYLFEKQIEELAEQLMEKCGIKIGKARSNKREEFKLEVKSLFMGRYPDGRPRTTEKLTDYKVAQRRENEWRYDTSVGNQPSDAVCPYAAHARVMNDRRESCSPTIIRRGMSFLYWENNKEFNGLYFLSYQASLEQLKVLYDKINENRDFIAYRGAVRSFQTIKYNYFGREVELKFQNKRLNYTELRAEAYFYAPPLSFLREIKAIFHSTL